MVTVLLPSVLLLVAAGLASGVLFKHRRLTTYVAAAATLFECQWLLLTLIHRTLAPGEHPAFTFSIGGLLLLLAWATQIRYFSWPTWRGTTLLREGVTIVTTLIVLAGAAIVFQYNDTSATAWRTHGFFNGDTATFATLVQRSTFTPGLLTQNPFAGNGYLEYPTLLHAGFASLWQLQETSLDWLGLLPLLTYLQIGITIPLFFLIWDVVVPEPHNALERWLGLRRDWSAAAIQSALVVFVAALSWDNFIYPQSHFFLTAPFLLLVSMLAAGQRHDKAARSLITTSALVALLIMLTNAVTGTAALILVLAFSILQACDHSRKLRERTAYSLAAAVFVIIFLIFSPGDSSLGTLSVSYTAALDILRLAPAVAVVLLGAWAAANQQQLALSVVLLCAAAMLVFFVSTRNIVVDNASRFFYHALLVGFPLAAQPLVRGAYLVRREVLYTQHSLPELATMWGTAIVLVCFLLLPAAASVISAHDHLQFQDQHELTAPEREALDWVTLNTRPEDVFIASPDAPWFIPLFTGRALLRTNYWLSPEDIVASDTRAAFAGNKAAQEQIASSANYIYLTSANRTAWEPLPLNKVFDNTAIAIYAVP